MPRVRRCTLTAVLCLIGLAWISGVSADCWYEEERHEEGAEVVTAEPCLNCTCNRGALLCYLRVCPRLPNPPPPGCILLHRYRTCCPELICTEIYNGNGLEARSEPDGMDLMPDDKTLLDNACVANGSIYGPGSAMDSSSLCEYCYCLGGKQTCVKPKCLLPIEGCTPMYEPTNCCPVHYNCTRPNYSTSSTTTMQPSTRAGGCVVDGVYYNEGGKVLGVGHSVCDNCYCLRGILRCEPLSCAPPLLGCSPVVRSGECCAASYNCSGTIEIQPEPNYGQFPIVSKEYAKLRKEVHRSPIKSATENSNSPYYVIAESSKSTTKTLRSPITFGTTRHFAGIPFNPSTAKPILHTMMELAASENRNAQSKFPGVYYATTNYEFQRTSYQRPYSTTTRPKNEHTTFRTINSITTTDYKEQEKLRSTDYLGLNDDALLSIVDSLLDNRLNRRVESKNETAAETTTEDIQTTTDSMVSTEEFTSQTTTYEPDLLTTTEDFTTYPLTVRTILNSTDCIDNDGNDTLQQRQEPEIVEATTVLPVDANEINKLAEVKIAEDFSTTSEESSTETTTNEVTVVDLESRVKVASATLRSIPKAPLEIEAILNISKNKEQDYEYDYNEPTLPPSLPNLRIIPFVAADALDSEKDKHNAVYTPPERANDDSIYTNLFSPPVETEGGFIPKDPPILENFYENAVTPPSITNTPKANCVSEGREIQHGQSVASQSACVTCTCFYGNIVCQKVNCPIPRPGCRKTPLPDSIQCCPHYVCDDEEAPTVVLDRLEGAVKQQEVVTVAAGVSTPDPFRDVIRTEPAPDLQSLIVDMMPFLARKTTPMPPPTTTMAPPTSDSNEAEDFSLDKVFQLLFANKNDEKTKTTTQQIQTTTMRPTAVDVTVPPSVREELNKATTTGTENLIMENRENSVDSKNGGLAILKLAGCNIYGRMYRVGRIISELSNPCLECKCTEIGVQCRALNC